MTIREAHKAWGGKADHLLTYHRTMNVFDKGFESLDLCRHINHYGIKDFAEALRKSGLNYANMHMAASVMCKVLEEYGTIDFTAEDLLDYKEEGKDQPATPPVMEESPECPPSVEQPRDTTAGKNSKTQKLTNSKVVKKKGITKPKPVNQIDPSRDLSSLHTRVYALQKERLALRTSAVPSRLKERLAGTCGSTLLPKRRIGSRNPNRNPKITKQ